MNDARQGSFELPLPSENERVADAVLRARLAFGGDITKFYEAVFATEAGHEAARSKTLLKVGPVRRN